MDSYKRDKWTRCVSHYGSLRSAWCYSVSTPPFETEGLKFSLGKRQAWGPAGECARSYTIYHFHQRSFLPSQEGQVERLIFGFLLFLGMAMYANEVETEKK